MTTADLRDAVAALETQKNELLGRLVPLRSGNIKPVDEEERTRIDAELRKWEKVARARTKIRREMWGLVKEACPEGTDVEEFKVCVTFSCSRRRCGGTDIE